MENKKASYDGAKDNTTLRMPEEMKELLSKEADKKGMSVNELIMFIFDDYFNPDHQ